jgi:hypothetical protein
MNNFHIPFAQELGKLHGDCDIAQLGLESDSAESSYQWCGKRFPCPLSLCFVAKRFQLH